MSQAAAYLHSLREVDLAQLPGNATERRKALDLALQLGLPDRHVEHWKYSTPAALAKQTLPLAGCQAANTDALDLSAWTWDDTAHLVVLVDGQLSPQLSRLGALPDGLTIKAATQAAPLKADEASAQPQRDQIFVWLNRALHNGGVELRLAANMQVTCPIHLLYVHTGGQQSHLHTHIQLGRNSQAQIVEHFVGVTDSQPYLCNICTQVDMADGAQLQHTRVQAHASHGTHVGELHIRQHRDSQLTAHNFDFSAAWSRHNALVSLDGPGASVSLDGVYIGFGSQHIDNHTFIDHRVPHGTSRERYRGILGGKARGVFNGMIMVRKDAQKTDSGLSSAALLLDRGAEVDAKPELEIYADDVKCSHGATVGQLDETAVFYLRSRGIDEQAARAMLTFSFAEELITAITPKGLRSYLETALLAQLPDANHLGELLQ